MIGPIRGKRLPAEVKLHIVRAVLQARGAGKTIEWACRVIMLDPRRLRRWLQRAADSRLPVSDRPPSGLLRASEEPVSEQAGSGEPPEGAKGPSRPRAGGDSEAPDSSERPVVIEERSRPRFDPLALTEADLLDRPPVARRVPHRLTPAERQEILGAADEDRLAHLRHRKLCHTLSREGRAFCSESSVLRVLRETGKVPLYIRRRRPTRPRPEVDESRPNRSWRYDLTRFPTRAGDYHLVPVIDACSRKIVGRSFGPEATSHSVQAAWSGSRFAGPFGLCLPDDPCREPFRVAGRASKRP